MKVLILGSGTAGTTAAAVLRRKLKEEDTITVVDLDDRHVYQPGLLLLAVGNYRPDDIIRSRASLLPPGVDLVVDKIIEVNTDRRRVTLAGGDTLAYDQLVIATGAHPRPDKTPGMVDNPNVYEFYSVEGAIRLRDALRKFTAGRLVIGVGEMPIKSPAAPLEFAFLAEEQLRGRGVREGTEVSFYTPLLGAFPHNISSIELGHLLLERNIPLDGSFHVAEVTEDTVRSADGRTIGFDMLVAAPVHAGSDYIERSGLGDALNYIPTDPGTTLAIGYDNLWVLGDASDTPGEKAGSMVTYQMPAFAQNLVDVAAGRAPSARYDGHTNFLLESGNRKAVIIEYNYDVEPQYGHFIVPWIGPPLLKESRISHLGKLAFRHIYWNALVKGRLSAMPTQMSMIGKRPTRQRIRGRR